MADQIVPFYLVVDENVPERDALLSTVSACKYYFSTAAKEKPLSQDLTRLCVIGFSRDARIVLPLSRPAAFATEGTLSSRPSAGSCYGAAFRLLKATIARDAAVLTDGQAKVSQPVVFFVSGNASADDWLPAHRQLLGSSWPPAILAFGYGAADAETLAQVANGRAFKLDSSLGPGTGMMKVLGILSAAIGGYGHSGGANRQVHVPSSVEGFTSLPPTAPGADDQSAADPTPKRDESPPSANAAGGRRLTAAGLGAKVLAAVAVPPTPPATPAARPAPPPARQTPAPTSPARWAFPDRPAIGHRPQGQPMPPLLLPDGRIKAPEITLDGADTDALSVRGASLRGADHRAKGASRQDALGVYQLRHGEVEAVLGCVADGADDAPLSHLGAAESCRLLADETQRRLPDLFAAPTAADLAPVCQDLVAAVADRLVRLAVSMRVPPGALSNTLAAAAVETSGDPGQRRYFTLVGGDCIARWLNADREPRLFAYDSVAEFGIEGAAGTALPASSWTATQHKLESDEVLVLSTGGLTKLLRDQEIRDGLATWWLAGTVPGLQEFAWQLSFRHASPDSQADDRTAICFWPRQPSPASHGGDQ
jgi:uncharacterized protein YegL/serine/threonine protein phosphatase PrpC